MNPLTEKQVLANLLDVVKRKTGIFITHRMIGLENIDTILVMDSGQIVECGSHHELVDHNGLYRRMWDLQNQIMIEMENANI
jgi:ABC-type transport system involved in Fe-S cluster assembly fused permease/ATPase subunit